MILRTEPVSATISMPDVASRSADSAEKHTAVAAIFIFGFLITLKNFRIFNTSEKYMRLSAV